MKFYIESYSNAKRFAAVILSLCLLLGALLASVIINLEGTKGEVLPPSGTISGFLWIDGNGSLPTDWNGLHDDGEQPLAGYLVSLFAADDRTAATAQTQTGEDGTYIFESLPTGDYVVGLAPDTVNGKEYLLPMKVTAESVFSIDWSLNPAMSFSATIAITEDTAVENINAGMRLPMGIQATAITDDIWAKNVNDSINIDGWIWYVVKKLPNYNASGINYVLLIRQSGDLKPFNPLGNNSNVYSNSTLREHYNKEYNGYATSTIKQLAVVPSLSLGSSSSQSVYSLPTATPVGDSSGTSSSNWKDAFFPLSYADVYEVNGNKQDPLASLFSKLPLVIWGRTAATTTGSGNVWGTRYNAGTGGTMDGGLSTASTNVYANPAVWVRTTPPTHTVTVNYINKDTGASIRTADTHTVNSGSTFTLSTIPAITHYQFANEWKEDATTAPIKAPPVSISSVTSNKTIYLYYTTVKYDVTVNYLDKDTGASIRTADTHTVNSGSAFTLSTIPMITHYQFANEWKEDATTAPIKTPPVSISNVASNKTIFLYYTTVKYTVTVNYINKDTGASIRAADTHTVNSGSAFTLSTIPAITHYQFINEWKEDATTAPIKAPPVSISNVTSNKTIYLYYMAITTLTVSKEVTGNYADKTKEFDFNVYFFSDSAGNTPLTSFHGGSMAFKLKHGQSITIEDVPQNCYIQITEAADNNYKAAFTDNGGADSDTNLDVKDTGIRPMTADRAFVFSNELREVVPAGIDLGNAGALLLLPALLLLFALSMLMGRAVSRKFSVK